jgi:hypothetical protein
MVHAPEVEQALSEPALIVGGGFAYTGAITDNGSLTEPSRGRRGS